jgi:hypothetical protein
MVGGPGSGSVTTRSTLRLKPTPALIGIGWYLG